MKQLIISALQITTTCLVQAQKTEKAVELPVEKVTEVVDFQSRSYPGKVIAVAQVNLVSRVSGEILELGFKNGAIVKAGQLLYRLDSIKYEAAVKNSEAVIAEYKARAAYAESNYKRNKQLSESKAESQRCSSRFVDDTFNFENGNLTGIFCCLAL